MVLQCNRQSLHGTINLTRSAEAPSFEEKTEMKRAALISAILAAVICAAAVWSQGRPGPGAMGIHRMSCPAMATMPPQAGRIDSLAKTLQLSKDQIAKLKKVSAESDKKLKPLSEQAAKSTQALRSAVLASKYNVKSVKELAAKAQKAEAAIVTANIDAWTKTRAILTTSQAAKLQTAINAHYQSPGQRPAGYRP